MKHTSLFNTHKSVGAHIVEFAGWEMPLYYSGIVDEHLAVRKNAGVFDVSHMGEIIVSGKDALKLIQMVQTNDLDVPVKKCKYTHILNDEGKIIDDMIVTRLEENKFFCVPNAGMVDRIFDIFNDAEKTFSKKSKKSFGVDATEFQQEFLAFSEKPKAFPENGKLYFPYNKKGKNVKIENKTMDYVCLAVQGPKSMEVLQKLTKYDMKNIKPFWSDHVDFGKTCLVTGTGYTGERGCEIFTDNDFGKVIWKKILNAGKEYGLKPCGLGCRNTLRLEKGYLLSGQDFHEDRTSLETNVAWVVKYNHDFTGKKALLKQKEEKHDKFVGFITEKGIPRHGCKIKKNNETVGVVTSGSMSPCLKKGIGLGYVKLEYSNIGEDLDICIRDKNVKAEIVKLPFV
ncbi:MAG: glycine cleavage system protein T [Candidatus Thermoplasmatota archaeon]|nr:glycine cleavage system protein T [Candidatus Thermoplasmatota archaeon]